MNVSLVNLSMTAKWSINFFYSNVRACAPEAKLVFLFIITPRVCIFKTESNKIKGLIMQPLYTYIYINFEVIHEAQP